MERSIKTKNIDRLYYLHYVNKRTILSNIIAINYQVQVMLNFDCFRKMRLTQEVHLDISNRQTKYRLNYGAQYQQMLEARDQTLEHEFAFNVPLKLQQLTRSLEGEQKSQVLVIKIKKFLIEAVSNVASVAFKFFCKGDLNENETKDYAAKNIMLNVHSIYRQTIKAIKDNKTVKNHINQEQLLAFRQDLAIEVDSILNEILINLSDNYPQAMAAGSTPRMREVITEVNRVEDQQNDLIFASGLRIKDFINQEGDYTSFIMKVVNRAINVTEENQLDARDRSVRQIFTQFNEQLFWLSQQNQYQQTINHLEDKNQAKIMLWDQSKPSLYSSNAENTIADFFNHTLERNVGNLNILRTYLQKEEGLPTSKEGLTNTSTSMDQNLTMLLSGSEKGIQVMKSNRQFMLGQKIPVFVKEFTKQELNSKQFSARHSSILRVLTKWADYLEDIFKNAEQYVRQRTYRFKTTSNQLVTIEEKSLNGKERLIKNLNEEYLVVKQKFQVVLRNNYAFISQFLAAQQSFASCVSHYSETRSVCSKINAVLTSLTKNYISVLVHHLLKAGKKIDTNRGRQDINLVVFRVSDLMRSKFECPESAFIALIKTLYLLDSSDAMHGKFKLVRIKNKLDEPSNNILINYLFMGSVLCQLQLSIQEPRGKQKNYYSFSHFAYELTRGKFGVMSQCAIMVSQLDPMIAACKHNYYIEKKGKRIQVDSLRQSQLEITRQNSLHPEENLQSIKKFEQKIQQSIFLCSVCKKLLTNENSEVYLSKEQGTQCTACIVKEGRPEREIKNEKVRSQLTQALQNNQLDRIHKFSHLQRLAEGQCLLLINKVGQVTCNVIIPIQSQFQTFIVRVSSEVMSNMESPRFDYSTLDYLDISKQRKDRTLRDECLIYLIKNIESLPETLLKLMELNPKTFSAYLKKAIPLFKQFRQQKTLIKTIKFKAEIIDASNNQQKWTALDQVVRVLALHEDRINRESSLKYKKCKHLELRNLKQIQACGLGTNQFPSWLPACNSMVALKLNGNMFQEIRQGQLPSSLHSLELRNNKLRDVNLSNLTKLRVLNLGNNQLNKIDLHKLISITIVELSENNLSSVDVTKQENLTLLDLSRNSISKMDINNKPNLQQIILDHNQLKTLNLSQLNRLTRLSLMHNQLHSITNVPPGISFFGADREVVLHFDFQRTPNLKELHVKGLTQRQEIKRLWKEVTIQYWD